MNATAQVNEAVLQPINRLLFDDLVYDLQRNEVRRGGRLLRLTPIGRKILEILLRESPGVVTREELEHAIWGEETPSYNILKVHIHRLRQDVDRNFDLPIIVTIPGRGFALRSR